MGDAAILRAQIPASTDPDRLEREARMAEVSERMKLRAALEATNPATIVLGERNVRVTMVPFAELQEVRAAAERYLVTLPNPNWTIRVFDHEGESHLLRTWYTPEEVMADLAFYVGRGARKIEIERSV